jgi:phosphatidylinositol alpha-1,6-mannosyltransferase
VRIAYVANALRFALKWRGSVVTIAAHPHLASVGWLCRVVGGGPYAVWCYGLEAWGHLRKRDRFGLERADRLVAISTFTARQVDLQLRRRGPIDVVLPCLDLPAARSVPCRPQRSDGGESPDRDPALSPRVLCVARLSPDETYKGVDTLVYSWPRVSGQIPWAELVIAGDGPDRARLEHSAALLGLDGRVHFLGQVSDDELVLLYAEAALFALPARTRLGAKPQGEGFGLVFIEAGAMGLPVVAGRGGGVDEAVIDGETGILVDPDDPDAVADAISMILSDPELGRCLGEAGRARAGGELSFEAFRRRVARFMEELVVLPGGMPCAES